MLSNISPKKPFTSPATTQRYRPVACAMRPPWWGDSSRRGAREARVHLVLASRRMYCLVNRHGEVRPLPLIHEQTSLPQAFLRDRGRAGGLAPHGLGVRGEAEKLGGQSGIR